MMQQRKLRRNAAPHKPARALGRGGAKGWARRPEIGQVIQRLRLERGWTRPQLADQCLALGYDVNAASVYQAETRGLARLSLVQSYAAALGVHADVLLGVAPKPSPLHDLARQILAHPRPSEGAEAVLWDAAQAVASRGEARIEGGQAGGLEEGEGRP